MISTNNKTKYCDFPIKKNNNCKRKLRVSNASLDLSRELSSGEVREYCHLHKDKELPPICTICISHVFDGKPKITSACNHVFHRECLMEFLRELSAPSCPNCRAPIENTYSMSSHQLGIPLLHIVQHTSEEIVEKNSIIRKERDDILSSLIMEWINHMKQIGQQIIAVHVKNFPFSESVNIIKTKYPECKILEDLQIILICPFALSVNDDEIVWP